MAINAMEKKSQMRGIGIVVEELVTVLNSVVRVGLLTTVTFEQRNKKKELRKCRGREAPVQRL